MRPRFRVLAPDLYACEQNGGPARQGAFTFEQDCALVERLIDIGGADVSLVGHSYGGVVAIKVALTCADRIARLILIEPSCFHLLRQTGDPVYAEIADMERRQQGSAMREGPEVSARCFIEYWMGPAVWPAMPERRRQAMALGIPKLAQDWRGVGKDVTCPDDYCKIGAPTLLLRAKDTKAPSRRIVDLILPLIPGALLREVESGGHMSPLTNPDPVNAEIDRFLSEGRPL